MAMLNNQMIWENPSENGKSHGKFIGKWEKSWENPMEIHWTMGKYPYEKKNIVEGLELENQLEFFGGTGFRAEHSPTNYSSW